MRKPQTIDEYLAGISDDDHRAALQKLRKTILSLLPDAEECISYGLCAFRHDGSVVLGFGDAKVHLSLYPFSGRTLETLKQDTAKYGGTRGSLHFSPEKGLPVALVRKIVNVRLAELAEQAKRPKKPRAARQAPRRKS